MRFLNQSLFVLCSRIEVRFLNQSIFVLCSKDAKMSVQTELLNLNAFQFLPEPRNDLVLVSRFIVTFK